MDPESGGGRLWIPWVRWGMAVDPLGQVGDGCGELGQVGQVGDSCEALGRVGQVGDSCGAPGSGRGQLWGRGRC